MMMGLRLPLAWLSSPIPCLLSSSSMRWAQTPIFNSRAEATPLGEECRMKQQAQTAKGACKALWEWG